MKKYLVSLIGLVCAVTFATAQNKKALLWEISGRNLRQPSYVFGTIHLLCESDLQITDNLKARLNATEQLCLEMDMDDPALMLQMMKSMNMHGDTTLKSLLPEEDYALVARFFQRKTGFPIDVMASAKPFYVMSMALPSTMNCPTASWELSLIKLAQDRKLETHGLETLQEQLAVIDRIPYKDQAAMLMEVIQDSARAQQDNQTLITLYKNQDIDGMQKEIASASHTTSKYEHVLLTERNQRWVPQMIRMAAEKPTFFAVGAGHLGGGQGVIRLLRKAGYQVKPVAL